MKTSILFSILLALAMGAAQAAPPERMNYQGVLRDAADKPLGGSYTMVFRFYDAAGGGNLLLTDTHTGGAAVTVSGGLFNALLGDGALTTGTYASLGEVFANEGDVYLEVQVIDETLTPRIRVASAGYALNSAHLDGRPAGGFIDTSAVNQTKAGDLALGDLTVTGNDIFFDGGSKIVSTPGNLQLRNDGATDDLVLLPGSSWHNGRLTMYGSGKWELRAANGIFEFMQGSSNDPIARLSADGSLSLGGELSAGDVSITASEGPLDLYVDGTLGNDSNDGLSPATAKQTIRAAVNSVPMILRGDVSIHVADGTYNESLVIGSYHRVGGLFGITIAGNELEPGQVVLDGEDTRQTAVFAFHDYLTVKGVTIRDYSLGLMVLGGVLRVENSTLTSNSEAGIFAFMSELEVVGCTIEANHEHGIEVDQSRIIFSDSEVTGNSQDGVVVKSSVMWLEDPPLSISNNGGIGVRCRRNSHVDFNGYGSITIGNNTGGDMEATYQSTIREYANATTGGCTADAHSTCEP